MQIKLDDISKQVAKDLGEKEFIVREINRIQWKIVFDNIRSNENNVKLIYLGKFSKKIKPNYDPVKRGLPWVQKPGI